MCSTNGSSSLTTSPPAMNNWPWYGGGFGAFNDIDVQTVQRYEASAEIVIGRGPIPRDNLRAFSAREVADRIGPTVRLPGQR